MTSYSSCGLRVMTLIVPGGRVLAALETLRAALDVEALEVEEGHPRGRGLGVVHAVDVERDARLARDGGVLGADAAQGDDRLLARLPDVQARHVELQALDVDDVRLGRGRPPENALIACASSWTSVASTRSPVTSIASISGGGWNGRSRYIDLRCRCSLPGSGVS